MQTIQLAQTDPQIADCFDVMVQLRPELQRESFVEQVRRLMRTGYLLAYLRADGNIVSVAGFRIQENLFLGRFLYVDDLVSDEKHQSRGYGQQLLTWLQTYARSQDCHYLELDSGVQRFRAHRFYLREGMDIRGHHFSMKL